MTIFKFNQQITRTSVETGIINLSLPTQILIQINNRAHAPTINGSHSPSSVSSRLSLVKYQFIITLHLQFYQEVLHKTCRVPTNTYYNDPKHFASLRKRTKQ